MLKKHLITLIITSVVAITIVFFMYSKNYIVVESEGIHIGLPQPSPEKHSVDEFAEANVEPEEIDVNLVSKVKEFTPSKESNVSEVEKTRMFDDMMKLMETVMPLAVVLIPIYMNKRNKRKVKTADA
jgi:hypothetical protein